MKINGRKIGLDCLPYVVAEMSGNHNGELGRALAIIKLAKEAGADAVKLQTYTADTITLDCDRPEFKIQKGLWAGRSLHELYQEAHTPWEWHPKLFEYAREIGITIFSAPFDPTAVDFLEDLGNPVYKIASPEIVDLPLIKKVAQTGKPIIMSTGMADKKEIAEAVGVARRAGCKELILLHCVSGYPTPPDEANLRVIPDLVKRFNVISGLSDHSMGTAVAVVSVAMGACLIEKHFTLSRADGGVDSVFSLEPQELKQLVEDIKVAFSSLGSVDYELKSSEKNGVLFRRSLYVVKDIKADEIFTEENVRSIRPGLGIHPRFLAEVLGRKTARSLKRGAPFEWSMIREIGVKDEKI